MDLRSAIYNSGGARLRRALIADFKKAPSAAFTLVEILVVVAIIGIVMTISIPTLYRTLNPDSIDKAVRDMMEACSHARAYAILNSVAVDLVIRAEDGQISIQPAGSIGRASDAFEDRSDELPAAAEAEEARPTPSGGSREGLNFSAKLGENVTPEIMEVNFQDQLEFTETRVRFYPNGTSDEFKCLMVHVPSGQRRLITLEVVTGLAEVESDPSKWR